MTTRKPGLLQISRSSLFPENLGGRAGEICRTAGRALDFSLYVLFPDDCIPERARLVQKEEENWGPIKPYAKKEER